jgi:hypothetical protein
MDKEKGGWKQNVTHITLVQAKPPNTTAFWYVPFTRQGEI